MLSVARSPGTLVDGFHSYKNDQLGLKGGKKINHLKQITQNNSAATKKPESNQLTPNQTARRLLAGCELLPREGAGRPEIDANSWPGTAGEGERPLENRLNLF